MRRDSDNDGWLRLATCSVRGSRFEADVRKSHVLIFATKTKNFTLEMQSIPAASSTTENQSR